MKKSSLVSIVAHSFVFIVLSFHQNLGERTPRGSVPQKVEIVLYSGEAALPELHEVEITQNTPKIRFSKLTTAPENSVNINKTSQIHDNNVTIPNNEFGRSPVSITSATPKKLFQIQMSRGTAIPIIKENSKLNHTLEEKYFQQYQSEQTKNTYATVSIQNKIKQEADLVKVTQKRRSANGHSKYGNEYNCKTFNSSSNLRGSKVFHLNPLRKVDN